MTTATPQVRSRWGAVIAIATGAFAVVILEFVPVGALPQITSTLGISEGIGGFLVTGPAFVAAIAAPPATIAIRRLDRRIGLLALTLLIVVSALIAATSSTFAVMMIARLVFGISIGGLFAIGIPAAGSLVPEAKGHIAATIVFAAIGIGSVISVPASALVATSIGWQWAFVGAAAIAAIAFLIQLFVVPKLPGGRVVRFASFGELFKSGRVVAILIVGFLVVGSHFASYTFVVPYLEQVTGLDHGPASAILLGFGVLSIVGNFGGGALGGTRLKLTVALTVVLVTIGVATVAIGGAVTSIAVVGLAIWGLAWGSVVVTIQQWVHHSSKHLDSPEASNAMFNTAIQFSIASGSFIGGLIVDAAGVRVAPQVAAIALAVAVILAVIVLATGAKRTAAEPASAPL